MPRHDDAPRDLLFGLLALQHGIVNRDQLVLAFGAWTGAAGKALADLLAEHGALDPPRRALLDAIADAHLKLHGGDPGRSLAALDVNRSTRESLAAAGGPEVEATMAHVGSGPGGDADRTSTYAVGTATAEGQRFRVLRPHARGGLGAVFVALDAELNREVALKRILDHHADDPVSRTRFLVEAEITGGLEHPGIVPVYGLGTYDGGRPYYAMRFIRGDSLKDAIERFHADARPKGDPGRRSLALRTLLRRFTDVCNAVEYAHSRGVLHRDIKPGNVIVGKHGETLVVDWGLAKPLGRVEAGNDAGERTLVPSSASGSAETLPGSALGTPAYMSPEQAAGDLDRLGPRSDVYSLGATLYCLLTGRAPFDGEVGEVLRKVRQGGFAPPRQVVPSVDRALEAVCLKAMSTRPEDRYASCRALADDVERWAADERVAAYPEPWTRTLVRWLTRHRTGVTAVAAAGLAVFAGLAAVAAVQARNRVKLEAAYAAVSRANTDLTRAKERVTQANVELASANAKIKSRYDLAFEAIQTFHAGVSEDVMLKEPQLSELRARLLGAALQFYRKLQAGLEESREPDSGAALADAYAGVAGITSQIGAPADSLAALRQALTIRERLSRGPRVPPRNDAAIAALLLDLSRQTRGTDPAAAEGVIARCRAILGRLLEADPGDRQSWDYLASCHGELAALSGARGDRARALEEFGQTLEINERQAREHPDDAQPKVHTVRTLLNIWNHQDGLGRTADALASARRAVGILEGLRRTHAADANLLGPGRQLDELDRWALLALARSQRAAGKPLEAAASATRSVEAARRVADALPGVVTKRGLVAEAEVVVGLSLLQAGKAADAAASFAAVWSTLQGLVDSIPAGPGSLGRRVSLADSFYNTAVEISKAGDPAAGVVGLRKVLEVYERSPAEGPAATELLRGMALCHHSLGVALSGMGKAAEAVAEYRKALVLYEQFSARDPADALMRDNMATCYNLLGVALSDAGDPASALAELRRALAIRRELAGAEPRSGRRQTQLATSARDVGKILSGMGWQAEALAAIEESVAAAGKAAEAAPDAVQSREAVAYGYLALGFHQLQISRDADALRSYDAARLILELLAKDGPQVTEYRRFLVSVHNNVAGLLIRQRRPAEARTRCDRALEIGEPIAREDPRNTWYKTGPAYSLRARGLARLHLSDLAGAAEDTRRALAIWDALPPREAEHWFESACCHATLASLAGRGGSGASASGANGEADRALGLLREAIARGYRNLETYRQETGLDALRDRDDFRLLLMDMAMPSDPFAPPH